MKLPEAIDVCGIEYAIRFVGPGRMSRESGVDECYGCVDFEKGVIYLDRALKKSPTRLRDTLYHEIGHALMESSGLGWWLKREVGLHGRKWHRFQETFIRLFCPVMITTFRPLKDIK